MFSFDFNIPKRPRSNSTLDLHNELTINLFNRYSNNLKFSLKETPSGVCLLTLKVNPLKYDQIDSVTAIAQIIKSHIPDLNNSKIGPLFNMLLIIADNLIDTYKLAENEPDTIFTEMIDYAADCPILNIHANKDPSNTDYIYVTASFKPNEFAIDTSDSYYECYFSGKRPNLFLKYLNFFIYHVCR